MKADRLKEMAFKCFSPPREEKQAQSQWEPRDHCETGNQSLGSHVNLARVRRELTREPACMAIQFSDRAARWFGKDFWSDFINHHNCLWFNSKWPLTEMRTIMHYITLEGAFVGQTKQKHLHMWFVFVSKGWYFLLNFINWTNNIPLMKWVQSNATMGSRRHQCVHHHRTSFSCTSLQ